MTSDSAPDSAQLPSPSPSSILHACSTGDTRLLQQHFSALAIHPPHPLIHYPSPPPPSAPPITLQMLSAALASKQPATLSSLLTTFPTTTLTRPLLTLATQHASRATFAVLLAHDPSILNADLGDDSTPLSQACACADDPGLALYLLSQGADPNKGWWFRLSTLRVALVRGQRLEVIRALVEAGAETGEEVESAVREGREGDLEVLARAGVEVDDSGGVGR